MFRLLTAALCLTTLLPAQSAEPPAKPITGETRDGVLRIDLLPPGPGNPRNSEGDFIPLRDGRVLFVYTHFTGGAADHAAAYLAARVSSDGGASWSAEDTVVVPNEAGQNVMSVSLLRLRDGRIALFYLRKQSSTDCRPFLRFSSDEGATWSDAAAVIPDTESGYYVVNNDRVEQLDDGRIIVPAAEHFGPLREKYSGNARMLCYLSDDAGATWRRGQPAAEATRNGKPVVLQEPGVVPLSDGRLMMYCRTDSGSQYASYSTDRGETWSEPTPTTLKSPLSPATIERIPGSNDLFALWNDHENIAPELAGKRTPLRMAISKDDGETWQTIATLEDNPHGWYCYTACRVRR